MDSPYLPVMIEECPKIADVQVSSWPSGKVRLVGTLHRKPYELAKDDVFLNVQQLEAQLIRPPKRPARTHFLPSDEIYLKSVTPSGEHKLILDFSLVPEKLKRWKEDDTVQVMGELKSPNENNDQIGLQVHIVRDFSQVCMTKYYLGISKQSLACPRAHMRRRILDTVLSPAPMAFLTSIPLSPSKDDSLDLFEDMSA